MRYRFLLAGLLLPVLLFAACAPTPELRDSSLLQDISLVDNEPCSAPCWRGITPGETEWSDALTLLEDDVTLENMQVQEDEESAAIVAEFQGVGGTACCQLYSEDGERVDLIFLRVAPTATLGAVIENKGDPTYVVGSPFSDEQAIMNVLYPDVPVVLYAFVEGLTGALSRSSEIIGILYLKPDDMSLLLRTSNLQAWEGFRSYQYYADSTLEITPAITLTPTVEG